MHKIAHLHVKRFELIRGCLSRTNKKVSAGTRLSTMLVPVAEEPGVLIQAMEAKKIRYGEKLPAGMVYIRGWLSTSDQIKIIEYIRNLGIGPGGFYTPAYSGGATLNLKMMCLGKVLRYNWERKHRQKGSFGTVVW